MLALSLDRLITSVMSVDVNDAKAPSINVFLVSIVSGECHWQKEPHPDIRSFTGRNARLFVGFQI